MKKLLLFTIALLFAVTSSWALTYRYVPCDANPLHVPCYATIQLAIAASSNGDIIIVAAGIYAENLTIANGITLLGPNADIDPNTGSRLPEAIINGGSGTAIIPTVGNIVINGFTITTTNSGFPIYTGGSDITGFTVSNNILGSGVRALTVATNGDNISILHNQFNGYDYGINFGGNGHNNNLKINNNRVNGNNQNYGIYLNGNNTVNGFELKDNNIYDVCNLAANISNGTVSGNSFNEQPWTGDLNLQIDVHNSIITGNTFEGNNTNSGLQLFGSQYGEVPCNTVTISGNNFNNCNVYGIQLSPDIIHITITNNTFTNCYDGVNTRNATSWDLTGRDIHINNNSITGSTHYAVNNTVTGTLDATCNWYGTAVPSEVAAKINGNVNFLPFQTSPGGPCNGIGPVVDVTNIPNRSYMTIQAAISAATTLNGDEIDVAAGIYPEHLVINKSNLTLLGANKTTTIIDATQDPSWSVAKAGILIRGTGDGIPGGSNNTVSGFTIRNAELQTGGVPFTGDEYGVGPGGMAGVQIYCSSGNTITGNIFEKCGYQVWILAEWAAAGYGNSLGNMISGNTISNSVRHGIYLYSDGTVSVNNTTITGNDISDAHGIYSGIRFAGDVSTAPIKNTTIDHNNITGCSRGIRIGDVDVSGISIHNNRIYNNVLYGLQNQSSSNIDATLNYWGYATGPYHPVTNVCGQGNAVSDNVTYSPWWTNFGMTIPSPPAGNTYAISGTIKYANNAATPLNGIIITLKKTSDNSTVGTYNTNTTPGSYQFTGIPNDNYYLELSSSYSGGAWQTWGGVNNTDYLLTLRHAQNITLLPTVPPVIRIAANVLAPATTGILVDDATAIHNAVLYGWNKPSPAPANTPWFDIPKWVFSGGLPSYDPLTGIVLSCTNVTRNILGLCAADVNASYLPPSGPKAAQPNLELINRGNVATDNEILLPVKADMNMELGAITLYLDYDASKFEITGVTMPKQGNALPYFIAENNVVQIGWASLEPVNVAAGETVLTIHGRVKDNNTGMIRFTLNSNPLSELANGDGIVINDGRLTIADIGGTASGDMISVYPNPAQDVLNIEYVMDEAGTFRAELLNVQGVIVGQIENTSKPAGMNKEKLGLSNLPSGVYMLRVFRGENINIKKVIINK